VGIRKVRTRDGVDLIESVGSDNTRDVSEEVRVIEGVEKLRAELQLMTLMQLEIPRDARIVKHCPGPIRVLRPQIAVLA